MIALVGTDQTVLQRWAEALSRLDRGFVMRTAESLHAYKASAPEICLYDLGPRGGADCAMLSEAVHVLPGTQFVALSARPDAQEGLRLLRSGIRGYCNRLASASVVDALLETVESGQVWAGKQVVDYLLHAAISSTSPEPQSIPPLLRELTKREAQIAEQVAAGLSNKVIAAENGITERTVKAHLNKIFRKTGMRNRVQLALALAQTEAEPRKISHG